MSNIFFTADTHFFHWNIIRHCSRPWSKEDHNEALIQRWNAIVGKRDTVYLLGDFAMISKEDAGGQPRMKMYRKLRHALNGKIILAGLGNHDKMSTEVYDCFTEVHTLLIRKFNKIKYTLCHYPLLSWDGSFHGKTVMLHGHCHGRIKEYKDVKRMDVGVDVWNYAPVPLELIEYKINNMYDIDYKDDDIVKINVERNHLFGKKLLLKG